MTKFIFTKNNAKNENYQFESRLKKLNLKKSKLENLDKCFRHLFCMGKISEIFHLEQADQAHDRFSIPLLTIFIFLIQILLKQSYRNNISNDYDLKVLLADSFKETKM